MILPPPECVSGYTRAQIEEILGDRTAEFWAWMRGQTMTLCEGRKYDHGTKSYVVACNGIAHGPVVYRWDLERFIDGRPIID